MNEDQCPGCGKWCHWDRHKVGDLHFHRCADGTEWVMSPHGDPQRIDARAAELLAERDAELCSEEGTDG